MENPLPDGWYYGLKLHLVIRFAARNRLGQVVSFLLTTGAKADNNHKALEFTAQRPQRNLFW